MGSSVMYEDRLEAATRRRLKGNVSFQAGAVRPALEQYALALGCMDEDFLMQLEGVLDGCAAAAVAVPGPTISPKALAFTCAVQQHAGMMLEHRATAQSND